MASWETPVSDTARSEPVDQLVLATAQRTFMARVYRWMFAGLAITGSIAMYTASTPAVFRPVLQFMFPLLIAELVLVFALSWLAPKVSGVVAATLFVLYAALNGLTFSILFLVYQLGSIGQAFLLTAGVFGAMSVFATVTKRDLSAWATFLFMGLIGVMVAGFVQMFWHSEGFSFVWSCACVVVFAGLTAYDTQKLRGLHAAAGYSSAASLSINGALMLYLDFVNLFLALLRLFGKRR
jgi:FtsH-binding integral membrane protein